MYLEYYFSIFCSFTDFKNEHTPILMIKLIRIEYIRAQGKSFFFKYQDCFNYRSLIHATTVPSRIFFLSSVFNEENNTNAGVSFLFFFSEWSNFLLKAFVLLEENFPMIR